MIDELNLLTLLLTYKYNGCGIVFIKITLKKARRS